MQAISPDSTASPERGEEAGFTLVELAIVLVIIGLIIGGVLKGQEMIESARLRSAVSQIDATRAAHITFTDKYGGLPGDLPDPTVIAGAPAWGDCNTVSCAGDGDGLIGPSGVFSQGEALSYWQHLAAANMISGIEVAAAPVAAGGQGLPSFPTGGVLRASHVTLAGATAPTNIFDISAATSEVGMLDAEMAYQIDRKIDDGRATSGGMVDADPANSGCADTASGEWLRATGAACRPFIRIQ